MEESSNTEITKIEHDPKIDDSEHQRAIFTVSRKNPAD